MDSKAKGSSFEREMSRLLSLWWTNGKRDDAIWRSASSGALTTVGRGRYLAHTGDFAATDAEAAPLFDKVIIEAKRGYNRYSVQDLLDMTPEAGAKNPTWQMFSKLADTCFSQIKFGFLIWKRDRRGMLVFMLSRPMYKLHFESTGIKMEVHSPKWSYYGMSWNDFTLNVSADQIRSWPVPPASSSVSTPSTSS